MDWLDYRERLGIGFNDEEKTKYFFTKIFNLLDEIKPAMTHQINEGEYFSFCNVTGVPMHHGAMYGEAYNYIVDALKKHAKDINDFIAHYIAFVNCQEMNEHRRWTKKDFLKALCNLLRESHLPFDIIEDGGSSFIFPKGAEELDDALVSDVLLWLKDYPLTQSAWISALKAYSQSTDENASETADKFRKALERFFQEFFHSTKSLENLKSTYGTWLSSKEIPPEMRNNFEKILEGYTTYNNNYAKHHDKVSECVLEYIMYQTGSLIRFLITLK